MSEFNITRITQAKEKDQKYFFNGKLNVSFEVLEWFTLDEVLWIFRDAKTHADNQGGLKTDSLYYKDKLEKILVIKSHFGQGELHEDYVFPNRDMTEGVVTMKIGEETSMIKANTEPELGLMAQTPKYYFEGIPKATPKVLHEIEPAEVLEIIKEVQDQAKNINGFEDPVHQLDWNGHVYRLVDNIPVKYLKGNSEINKLAELIHFITIDWVE